MQGKMKSFFEDTGIILVLTAAVYGGYLLYTSFVSDTQNLPNPSKPLEKTVILKKEPLLDNNKTIEIKEVIAIDSIEKTINIEPEKIEIELPRVIKINPPAIAKAPVVKKEKNVDLSMLRIFLRNLKFQMASNIIKRDDINETISQELKIRVTVLKDGSYEDLIFVSGDEKLFEMNKENILRIFPVRIDDKIKDEFPRYVRISIK